MKRRSTAIMLALLLMCGALMTGCGGGVAGDEAAAGSEEVVSEDAGAAADDQSSGDWNDISDMPEIDISALGGEGGVDVDLSVQSSTMVYAIVYDMMIRPNEYIGKVIRMKGAMSTYHDESTGNTYYACLISDATACCSQGIEFQAADGSDPSDFPPDGEEVTVKGTYDLYEDGGYEYCVLYDAVIE